MRDIEYRDRPLEYRDGARWVGVVVALLLIAFGGTVLVYRTSQGIEETRAITGTRQVTITLKDQDDTARTLVEKADQVGNISLSLE